MEKLVNQMIVEAQSLSRDGRAAEAIFSLERIAVEALNVLGLIYFDSTQSERISEKYLKMSLNLDRGNWMVHSNLSHVLNWFGHYEEALEESLAALQWANNTAPEPYYNAGVIYSNLKKFNESIEMYRAALKLTPENKQYQFNLSNELLRTGKYDEGWEKYEIRLEHFEDIKNIVDRFKAPKWNKTKVGHLSVFSEQGIGDVINFARYLPKCHEYCDKLTFEVQEEIADFYRDIADVVPRKTGIWNTPSPTDAAVSVCSLPGIFGAKENPIPPYINFISSEKPDELNVEGKKIGIVWAGNPNHPYDRWRSCPLSFFKPLADIPNIKLFSLQKEFSTPRQWQNTNVNLSADVEGMQIVDLGPKLLSFKDTANYISHLDLVISVDTGVAHLAGALGKPVWLLNAFIGDWRWGIDIEKTNWYPSMTIFRQKTREQWGPVFEEIVNRLSQDLRPN